MKEVVVNKDIFNFKYLPEFASFILRNRLEEFVTVGIRFCREVDLPILKPLSKFSEQELVNLSIESNKELLGYLAENKIAEHIERGAEKWRKNEMAYIDREDLMVEDLTLGFYLRRKILSYFLDAYTRNVVMQKFIIAELDIFTTQEELIAYQLYFITQLEKKQILGRQLEDLKSLYRQNASSKVGCWSWDLGSGKLQWSEEMYSIFELPLNTPMTLGEFVSFVHADDKERIKQELQRLSSADTRSEYIYSIRTVNGKSKTLRGVSMVQSTEQKLISRCFGTCEDITEE